MKDVPDVYWDMDGVDILVVSVLLTLTTTGAGVILFLLTA